MQRLKDELIRTREKFPTFTEEELRELRALFSKLLAELHIVIFNLIQDQVEAQENETVGSLATTDRKKEGNRV